MERLRKKRQDVLEEQKVKLHLLTEQLKSAVDSVTRIISGLELVNQELEDTISEIDAYCHGLMETKESMQNESRRNTAIINNFSKLLEVSE